MLKAIRTDLKEFYNAVQDDTYEKVKVSSDLSSDLKEFYADFYLDTSMAVQQVKHDTIKAFDKLDDKLSSEILISWDYQDAVQEAEFRMDVEQTYVTPLLKVAQGPEETKEMESVDSKNQFEAEETRAFLEVFDIRQRTEEIVAILEAHPDTVKAHFLALVPVQMTYEEFWERFFFRCNVDLIVRLWTANDERIRATRMAAMGALKKTLASPLSAVVKPLKSAITWDTQEAVKEAEFRMVLDEVYLSPLIKPQVMCEETKEIEGDDLDLEFEAKETEVFLESFDITRKTEEIADLLEKYPDTLKARFEALVPLQVSYEDFWERFFFRCDVDRIVRVWIAKDERTRATRNETLRAWTKTLGNPVSLVANPLKTVFVSISTKLDFKTNEIDNTETTVEVTKDEVLSVQQDIAASQDKMIALRVKFDEAKKHLLDAKKRVRVLKTDLLMAHDALRDKGQEDASEGSSGSTAYLTVDCEDASVANSFSSSNGGDVSTITESTYFPVRAAGVRRGKRHDVREDSTSRSLEDESLTEFEEDKEEPVQDPVTSPSSLLTRLKMDTSSMVKFASLSGLWRVNEETVQDGWDHEK